MLAEIVGPTALLCPVLGVPLVTEPFGAYMRRKRQEKNLTLEEVGDRFGTSHVTIQRYESGTRYVNFDVAMRWADAVGVSRAETTTAWVAANGGEITYEPDPDSIPVPEGYDDLPPEFRAAANRAAQEAWRSLADVFREVRRDSPGTVGFGAHRYDRNDESGEPADEEQDGSPAKTGRGEDTAEDAVSAATQDVPSDREG